MKKFITVSTAVALFGAALLFVGCTKDYGQDISDVKKDVEELQSDVATANKNIETLQTSVKELQDAKTKLEEADKDLQNQITSLDSEKANKTDLESVKTELQKADAELQKQITSINSTLSDVQTTLALKADKSYVDKTFATQEALDKVSETLGELSKTVEKIDQRLTNVENVVDTLSSQGGVTKILERLSEVETGLSKANKAITDLGNELHTLYYTSGQIDAMLNYQDSVIRETLVDSALNIRTAINDLNDKLVKEVEISAAADRALQEAINAEERARVAADLLLKYSIDSLGTELTSEMTYRKTVDDSLYLALCGEIDDRKDADKESADTLNAKILQEIADRFQADKENADSLNAKIVKEINDRIVECGNLQDQIDDIIGDIEGETLKKLRDDITKIQGEIDAIKSRLSTAEGKITALASRVESMSVCPTLNEEIIAFKYGNDVARMMRVTIAVTPADAIDYICANKDSLHLIYAQGYQRTKSNVEYKEAKILEVKAEDNTIVILANSVIVDNELAEKSEIGTFFAAAWGDVDAAGKTRVISDFAQAVEGEFDIADKECFKYAYLSKSDTTNHKIKWVNRDSLTTESSYDYKQAATAKEKPFTDYFVAYDNSVNVPDDVKLMLPKGSYTLYQLSQLLNCEFVASETVTEVEPAKIVEDKGFETEYNFVPAAAKGLNDYVRDEPYTVTLQGMVNGNTVTYASSSRTLNHNFYITPLDKGQFDLGTARVYWNWKTYYTKDRKAVIDPSTKDESVKAAWLAAYEAACKVAKKLGNGSETGLDYAAWNENDSTQSYYPDITLSLLADVYDSTAVFANVKDTIKKQNDTVMYKFAFETIVDTPCPDQTVNFSTTVRGSMSLADTIAVPNFLSSILAEKPGDEHKVKSIFINGLSGTDVMWTNIYEGARKRLRIAGNVTVVDDATGESYEIKLAQYGHLVENDTFSFIVPAGTWGYNEDHNVTCTVKDLFGFKYEAKVAVKTGEPLFWLVFKPLYVKCDDPKTSVTGSSVARGKITDKIYGDNCKKYSIENMYYAKYINIEGNTSNEADGATISVAFFNDGAEYYGEVDPTVDTVLVKNRGKATQGLDESELIVWTKFKDDGTFDGYNNRQLDVNATLLVNKKSVNKKDDYTGDKLINFTTPRPVKLGTEVVKQEFTRIAETDINIELSDNMKVYGFVDDGQGGKYDETSNLLVSGIIPWNTDKDYGCKLVFDRPETITVETSTGTTATIVEGIDYDWDDQAARHDNSGFVFNKESGIFKEGVKEIKFSINFDLLYNLDNNEKVDAQGCEDDSDKLTGKIEITIKQE